MPHIKKHNIQIKVKSELLKFTNEDNEIEKINYVSLCETIAFSIGIGRNYTYRNGDIWVNKITQKQLDTVLACLDIIIYREQFMPQRLVKNKG